MKDKSHHKIPQVISGLREGFYASAWYGALIMIIGYLPYETANGW